MQALVKTEYKYVFIDDNISTKYKDYYFDTPLDKICLLIYY